MSKTNKGEENKINSGPDLLSTKESAADKVGHTNIFLLFIIFML